MGTYRAKRPGRGVGDNHLQEPLVLGWNSTRRRRGARTSHTRIVTGAQACAGRDPRVVKQEVTAMRGGCLKPGNGLTAGGQQRLVHVNTVATW